MKKYLICTLFFQLLFGACTSDKYEINHPISTYSQSMESYKYDKRNDSIVIYKKDGVFLFELYTSRVKLGDNLDTVTSFKYKNDVTISVRTSPYDFDNDNFESDLILWEMKEFTSQSISIYLNDGMTFKGKLEELVRE